MDFLDKLVLPQSAEQLQLLHIIQTFILTVFVPFASMVLGGIVLSVLARSKGDKFNKKFAKDIIGVTGVNKYAGIIFGIIPLFVLVLIFTQLLSKTNSAASGYIIASFVISILSFVFIYMYKNSISVSSIFENIKEIKTEDEATENELEEFKNNSAAVSTKSGKPGAILLFAAMWLFAGAITISGNQQLWSTGLLFGLFGPAVIIKVLLILSFSICLAASSGLFYYFFWNKKSINNEEYKQFVKTKLINTVFYAGLLLPVLVLLNTMNTPKTSISNQVFVFTVISLVFILVGFITLYGFYKNENTKHGGGVFVLFALSFIAIVIKDQAVMSNATQLQRVMSIAEFQKTNKSLLDVSGTTVIKGIDVFTQRCSACHSFDKKIVGPPYKETMPKYEGKEAELVAFILNPKKVNPAFPVMPPPGVTEEEAKAVAKYILSEYKNK